MLLIANEAFILREVYLKTGSLSYILNISYSYKGRLWSNVTPEQLRGALVRLQNKLSEEEARNNSSRRTLGEIGKNAFKKKKPGPSEKDDKEKDSKGKEGGAHG